MTQV